MLKNSIVSKIAATKVMAVVRINTRERAIEIVEGLLAGGVDVMEISYNSDNASDHIRFICKNYPDMLVGAGTVLDSETARMAIDAGAKFIIAPTFSKDVAKLCNRYQIPYCPGCTTCNEMVEAMEYGASFIKCFPISNFYGPDLVKIFKTPLPLMPVMVSGGVSMDNIDAWLKNGADCLAMGGLLTKGGKDDIAASAKKVMERVHGGK